MARTIAKDHDQKRLHILVAAAEVFAREGIARSSMNEVAKSCGISKANIYHYYDGKEALLFAILDDYLSALRDKVCHLDIGNMMPEEQLRTVCREFLFAYDGMDHQHKIQTEGISMLPLKQQEVLKGYQREMVEIVSTILAKVAPDTLENERLRETTMSVFGMLNWFYMWNPKADQPARSAYANTVTALMLDGVRGFETP